MLFPLTSIQDKLLQLFYFQEEVNLNSWPVRSPKTMLPYEKWFLNEYHNYFKLLDAKAVQNCLNQLKSFGLIQEDSPVKFRITPKGSHLAYILAEYTKQVHLRDILDLIEIKNLFDGMPRCPRLLDVGCGGGASLIAIDRHKFGRKKPILVGLDIDPQNLSFGKKIIESIFRGGKKVPAISFIQGDAVNLPLKPQSLHIVYSRVTFHLLKRHAFLDEAKRVLMSKGRLILVTPGYRYFWRSAIHSLRRGSILSAVSSFFCIVNGIILRITGNQIRVRNTVSYSDTPAFLAQTLRKAGFHVLKCEYQENPFYVSPIVAIAEKL